jgi:hypothetical protein
MTIGRVGGGRWMMPQSVAGSTRSADGCFADAHSHPIVEIIRSTVRQGFHASWPTNSTQSFFSWLQSEKKVGRLGGSGAVNSFAARAAQPDDMNPATEIEYPASLRATGI